MSYFGFKKGRLFAEDISVAEIAGKINTPFYCYSSAAIRKNFTEYQNAFADSDSLVAFALKANSNQAVLTLLAKEGAGADVVSEGELRRALAAGIRAEKIVFSGVGKTISEIDYALSCGIYCFNVESIAELDQIAARAQALAKIAPISLRINPDIDAQTHTKIATGKSENKFGIPLQQALMTYIRAKTLPSIAVMGVDMHIGSQICDLAPFEKAFSILRDFIKELSHHEITLAHVDIGGGLGIDYGKKTQSLPKPLAYALLAKRFFQPLGLKIICEPGRSIVGDAGVLVTKVIYVKENTDKTFVIVDAAMNDLIRPTLYDAWQNIAVVEQKADRAIIKVDIVGPICETGDYLGLDRNLPEVEAGELIAVFGAGAYGAVMSGTYNSRRLIPEVMVHNDLFHLVRPRMTYDQLIAFDDIPHWI